MNRNQWTVRTALAGALVVGAVTAVNSEDEKMVPVEIKLPKPMFVGTPTNIKNIKIDPVKGTKARGPTFQAPEGTKLISQGKPVTSSDREPIIGDAKQVTDGDKEGGDGSYVEFGPGKQYVQIDLGAESVINGIVVWHYHTMARVYRDIIVQVADDADFITNVRTLFNNDYDNSSGLGVGKDYEFIETNEGKLIEVKGVKARYVRLYSNGNTANELNHYVEVEVYGKAP